MAGPREISVDSEHAGERLDRFVAGALGLSRGYVRRLLRRGLVELEGAATAKGGLLREGDTVHVAAFRHPDEGPIPAPHLPLPVLCRGQGLVAFDKPPGMPTHPLDYEETDTALNAALARFPSLLGIGEAGLRSGVVHRLDSDTSGVLVFATEKSAWREARAAFRDRLAKKRYVARVHGPPPEPGEIRLRLAHRGQRMRVVARGGREAVTRILAARAVGATSLLEIELVTGVTHQIRATLAHLEQPVVGDAIYGSRGEQTRHWLHATSIRIGGFEASSPPPPELR